MADQQEIIDIKLKAISDVQSAIKDLAALNRSIEQLGQVKKGPSQEFDQLTKKVNETTKSVSGLVSAISKSDNASSHVATITKQVSNLKNEFNQVAKSQGQVGISLSGSKAQQSAQWKEYTDNLLKYQYALTATPKSLSMAVRNVNMFRKALSDTSIAGKASIESIAAMNRGEPVFMKLLTSTEKFRVTLAAAGLQAKELSYSLRKTAQDNQWAAKQLMMSFTLPFVGLAQQSVSAFGKVSAQMAQIKKITDFEEDYNAFTQSIRNLGREFGTTRLETTTLYRNIAELGTSGLKNIEDYVRKVQNLSLVSGASLDDSLLFFRTVKAVFAEGMPGMDTTQKQFAKTDEIIAQFNTIADRTTIKLSELAEAFPEVAPVMEQMGFSAAGVGASIASIHKAGIPAVEAAHALKFGLQRIADPTKQAKQYIDAMNFSFFDAKGNITNADKQVMAFAQSLSQLNDEQKLVQIGEIFGKRQAARLSVFVDDVELGRKELLAFNEAMKNGGDFTIEAQKMQSSYARALVFSGQATGEASRATDRYSKAVEEIKKDPSVGLKRMKATFDDVKIQIGSVLAPAFISLGEKLGSLAEKFTNLSPTIQKIVLSFIALVAAVGPIKYVANSFVAVFAAGLKIFSIFTPFRTVLEGTASALVAQGKPIAQIAGKYLNLSGSVKRLKTEFFGVTTSAEANTIATEAVSESQSIAAANAEILSGALNNLTASYERVTAAAAAAAVSTKNVADSSSKDIAKTVEEKISEVTTPSGSVKKASPFSEYEAMRSRQILAASTKKKEAEAQRILNEELSKTVIKINSLGRPYDASTGKMMKMTDAIKLMTEEQRSQVLATAAVDPVQKYNLLQQEINKTTEAVDRGAKAVENYQRGSGAGAQIAANELRRRSLIPVSEIESDAKKATKTISDFYSGMASAAQKTTKTKPFSIADAYKPIINSKQVSEIETAANTVEKASGGIMSAITGFLSTGPGIAIIISLVFTLGAVIFGVFLTIKDHMEQFKAAMKPGIDAIKDAWNGLKEAFKSVGEIFSNVFGQLGNFSSQSDDASAGAKGLGSAVSTLASGFAKIIDAVAGVIRFLKPFFESIAYRFKDLIGVVESLLKGDWKKALAFLLAGLYETIRPALMILDVLLKAIAQVISSTLGLVSKIPLIGSSFKGAAKAVESFSDKGLVGILDNSLRDLGGVFDSANSPENQKAAADAGTNLGTTLGDNLAGAAGDSAKSWVTDWVTKVVSSLDEELKRVRDSAVEALKKSHEEALKTYDERIKAIDDQEKAEEKLYRTEEYLSKKRELLDKRNIDLQNYKNNRAKAIYEGRYNDVRIMDMEEQKNKKDYSDQVSKIEIDRQKDLLKDYRDNLKNQINAEKEAAKEKFDIQEKYFEALLDGIMKQTPLTVEEFQNMMNQINTALSGAGVDWPGYAVSAMERFAYVINDANDKVINDFRRSGEDAVTAWLGAFARPEVKEILQKLSPSGGGGGGGPAASDSTSGNLPVIKQTSNKNTIDGIKNEIINDVEAGANEVADAAVAAFGGSLYNANAVSLKEYGNDLNKYLNETTDEYFLTIDGEIVDKNTAISRQIVGQMSNIVATTSETMYKMYKKNSEYGQKLLVDIGKNARGISNDIIYEYSYTTKQAIQYMDKQGGKWFEVNGELRNQYGQTAKFIRDNSGNITGILTDDMKNIEIVSTRTFIGARNVIQEMNDRGLKPGSAEAQIYIQKINDLGYAVDIINGKYVAVKIDINTEAFWRNATLVENYLQSLSGMTSVAAMFGNTVFQFGEDIWIKYASGEIRWLRHAATGGYYNSAKNDIMQFADGGLVKQQKNGVLAQIGEGGYDEYVITTDPKYRSQNIKYLISAASQLGLKAASGAAVRAYNTSSSMPSAANTISESYSNTGGDTYISVDTFIGQEEWFAEMAKKHDMKTVSKGRKIAGQQKRVISSYNNRWDIR